MEKMRCYTPKAKALIVIQCHQNPLGFSLFHVIVDESEKNILSKLRMIYQQSNNYRHREVVLFREFAYWQHEIVEFQDLFA